MFALSSSSLQSWTKPVQLYVCMTLLGLARGESRLVELSSLSSSSSSNRHRLQTFVVPTKPFLRQNNNQQYHHFHQQQPSSKQPQRLTANAGEEHEQAASAESASTVPPSNRIVVSGEIELPVPATVAFDAWADLPRQPTWSPWLRAVSYIPTPASQSSSSTSSPLLHSKWTMSYFGLKFSWNSVTTTLDRPRVIAWESTSGTKNYGRVEFVETSPETTRMKLTLTFVTPRILTILLVGGGSRSEKATTTTSTIGRFVDQKLTQKALRNFRQVVIQDYAAMTTAAAAAAKRGQELPLEQ